MVNFFESFKGNIIDKENINNEKNIFLDIFEEYISSEDANKKYSEMGLEFAADGYVLTLKKGSKAAEEYSELIGNCGNEYFSMDNSILNGDYYVFTLRNDSFMEN